MICPKEKNIAQAKSVLASAIAVNKNGLPRRERPPRDPATDALIQMAHNSRASCSETHSRQKGRWHMGQRQTAPRTAWFQQCC